MKACVAALIWSCLTLPVLAQDQGSSAVLHLAFPDAPARFDVVPGRAGLTRFSALDAISLEGQAGRARLVIELALQPDAGPDPQPLDARVIYRRDGFGTAWQSIAPPGPDSFAFHDLALSGPHPRIAGTFTLPLCHRATLLETPDPERCKIATGRFDTVLQLD
ncbi:MAG: hypothetical protein EA386_08210 [Rhodobacteraceae bacterium]|nr:MAG: hypothetical protein EA386_08210 [Paracoccaceae bacterium]